jgi:hypothetical protein
VRRESGSGGPAQTGDTFTSWNVRLDGSVADTPVQSRLTILDEDHGIGVLEGNTSVWVFWSNVRIEF